MSNAVFRTLSAVAIIISIILFISAKVQEDVVNMIWWGFIAIINQITLLHIPADKDKT